MRKKFIAMFLAMSLITPAICVNAEENVLNNDVVSINEMLDGKDYKKGELILVFKDNVSTKKINNVVKSEDGIVQDIKQLDDTNKSVEVKISSNTTMEDAIESFKENKSVKYVQPNYKYSLKNNGVYNDPSYGYHMDLIKAKEAWSLVESKGNITKVSVIDTGVDIKHEDLQKNLVSNSSYIRTLGGKRISTIYDSGEHGTHVTGIIGATYGNGIGISGVASGTNNNLVKIMVVGTSSDGYNLYTSDVIEAINYSKENGAKVINMSFGGEGRDRAMEAAIKDAYDSGIVLVAASGNDSVNTYSSPSDFKEVISVNASNVYNKAMYWSDYGTYKDITAPGYNIMSTLPGDIYNVSSGTSMASPVVSAVVALMLDANPNLTPAEVYNILCASTGQTYFDEELAYGIVDAKSAVEASINASNSINASEVTIKDFDAEVYENDDITLESLVRPATSLKKVKWESSDTSIATVDENTGRVTGVTSGIVTITATIDDKSDSIKLRVKESKNQTSITIENKDKYKNIVKGFSDLLYAKITPEDATNNEVYWTSSNRTVVDIDEYGIIDAKEVGTATITAKTYDGRYSDSFTINVSDPANIEFTKLTYKILIGNTYTYKANVLDSKGKVLNVNNEIIWGSTNQTIAKIDSKTGKLTPLKPGTTYITATVKDADGINGTIKKSIRLYVGKSNYANKDYNLKVYSKTYNSITLKWNKIPVMSKYVLERATKANGPYTVINNNLSTSTTKYTDKNLKLGQTYYYRIKGFYSNTKSFDYSYVVNTKTTLNTPVLYVNNYKTKSLKLSWKKVPGATKYVIYRSSSAKGPYKAIISTSKTSYINKNLKKNKKYYYKLRAYKVVDGKRVYSPYSSIKSRITK